MAYSVNTRPLLEDDISETEEENCPGSERDEGGGSDGNEVRFHRGTEPKDWYRCAYLTFYLLGIVTLLPYTFFATANDYWMYKLRNTNGSDFENKTALQAEFTSYLTIAASGPSVFFMIINSLFCHRISVELRMFGSLVVILVSFIVTTAFVEVNTDTWQDLFFILTLLTVVIVNVFGSFLTAGLFGIASRFSSRYISAVVSGQALGGMFPALVYIISLAIGVSSTHCALLYFNIANITIVICLASYYAVSRSLFYRYHMLVKAPVNTLTYDPVDEDHSAIPRLQISVRDVFLKTWEYGIAAMLTFMVTISIYPGVSVLIDSVNAQSVWTDKFFVPVVAFLIFSIWDYIGRVTAGWMKWPLQKKWIIMSMTLIRVVFIPVFLLCNANPRHHLPLLVNSDSAYVATTCLFGFSNGYLTNIILINVPKIVDAGEQETASSIIATFISTGCAFGALLSFIFVRIL